MYISTALESSAPTPQELGVSSCVQPAHGAGLGRYGKSFEQDSQGNDRTKTQARRAERLHLRSVAARHDPHGRVCSCGSNLFSFVDVRKREGRARVAMLETCGSVWTCPVCSSRISEQRRQDLNQALAWARDQDDLYPVMLTLTLRHHGREGLDVVEADLREARTLHQQRKAWRVLKADHIEGQVTAMEVTHGKNGWHPHLHIIVLIRADSEDHARALVESTRGDWLDILGKRGRPSGTAAFQVQGAAAAGDYVTKWGAGEEMSLSHQKSSKAEKGKAPFDLLRAADAGDETAGLLFWEYATVMHGRRQLVWSQGLKDKVGLLDVSDDDAARDDRGELVYRMRAQDYWYLIRQRQLCSFLDHIERGGDPEAFLARPGRAPVSSDELDQVIRNDRLRLLDEIARAIDAGSHQKVPLLRSRLGMLRDLSGDHRGIGREIPQQSAPAAAAA